MSLESPLYLLLLLLLPLVPWVAGRSREEPAGARRTLASLVRALLLVTLVLALSRPTLNDGAELLSVTFAIDGSASIGAAGRAEIQRFLAVAKRGLGPRDRAAIVVFGEDAVVEAAPSPLLPLPPFASRPGVAGSDLGAGLRLATALFEPGVGRRVVVLTDGEENRGSLFNAASATTAAGIDLVFVPIASERVRDVVVESLSAPPHAAAHEPIDLRLVVRSPRRTPATLRFYQGRDLIASDTVTLEADRANLFVLRADPAEAGLMSYTARIEVDGDAVPQNNAAETTVEVRGAPRVLLVSERPERLLPLRDLLGSKNIAAEVSGLDGIPVTLSGLRRYGTILLANVAAEDLGDGGLERMAAYVREAGQSLIMAGGERSFGLGGYLGTAVEEVLPVWMEVKERRYYPSVALVTAIDKSGSMAGVGTAQKIEVAKAGAAAAIEILDSRDEAGVVGFDDAAQWVVKLQPLAERASMLRRLATLRAGGGTDIYPAMVEGGKALAASTMRVKHLILLSDGQSPGRDYQGLARDLVKAGITVTTVAVGADADAHTMRAIAQAGKGRSYVAVDPAMLPRIFTKEALTIQRSFVVEESFRPRLVTSHEILTGIDLSAAPALHGYVATFEKGLGEQILASPRNDPILSVWRAGLGKSAVFTPDVEGQWSRDWVRWDGWGRLMSQLFRWGAAAGAASDFHVSAVLEGGRLHVAADVVDHSGEYLNFANLEGVVTAPGGKRTATRLRQVGPGRYEANIAAGETGAHLITVRRADAAGATLAAGTATVDVPYSAEFRPAGEGRATLERVAGASGARLGIDPAQVFAHDLPIPGIARPLRPLLLWLLPFLLLLDVGVRRVALPDGWLEKLATRLPRRRVPGAGPATAPSRLLTVKQAAVSRRDRDATPSTAVAVAPPPVATAEERVVAPAPTPRGSTTDRLLDVKRKRPSPP